MRVRHLMPTSRTDTNSARPGRIQIAHTSSSPVPFHGTTDTRALRRRLCSITTWHDQSPCSSTLLPGHGRAAFGAVLLRTRLSGRVSYRVPALGANTIPTRPGGVRAAHASLAISLCHDTLPFCTSVLIELTISSQIRPGHHAGLDHGLDQTPGLDQSLHGSTDRTNRRDRLCTRHRPHTWAHRRA